MRETVKMTFITHKCDRCGKVHKFNVQDGETYNDIARREMADWTEVRLSLLDAQVILKGELCPECTQFAFDAIKFP